MLLLVGPAGERDSMPVRVLNVTSGAKSIHAYHGSCTYGFARAAPVHGGMPAMWPLQGCDIGWGQAPSKLARRAAERAGKHIYVTFRWAKVLHSKDTYGSCWGIKFCCFTQRG